MAKILMVAVFAAVIVALGSQIAVSLDRRSSARLEFNELQGKLDQVVMDQERLQADLEYIINPANLEKELRQRFNYREPGEKLIIIVPPQSSEGPTSTVR